MFEYVKYEHPCLKEVDLELESFLCASFGNDGSNESWTDKEYEW